MTDLRPHRPNSTSTSTTTSTSTSTSMATTSVSAPPGGSTSGPFLWAEPASRWVREAVARISPWGSRGPVVDRFAERAAAAREPEEVRVELVRIAARLSGATRVELYSDKDGRAARRLASWPPVTAHETTTEAMSALRGPVARTIQERPMPSVLHLPLKAGDFTLGSLRLVADGRRIWSPWLVRKLTTLCAIASTAERGLARSTRGEADPNHDPSRGAHGSTILAAFLTFAQAQARRRHESLSMMEVGVDRLDSIRELLGDELAESAVERVFRAIKATVRASDVVARLEEGRIAVLLPNASAENAAKVAEAVRVAIARAGAASTTMPSLTASIGVATYPDHAHDVATLRAAAASTLTRARDQGNDRIAIAPAVPPVLQAGLTHRVG